MSKIDHFDNEVVIAVIGLGYVGLPTALAFHKSGFNVIGVDISESVVEKLHLRESPLIDSSVEVIIPEQSETWKTSSDFSKTVPESDIILITVPTPINKEKKPDLTHVESALKNVLSNLGEKSGKIIVLESTVFPGVTESISNNLSKELNLEEGRDFHLAYSPERVSPGDESFSIGGISRIIGANEKDIGERLVTIYSEITSEDCTYVGSIKIAEASKLMENVQRDVDIALTNEMAIILQKMEIDVEEVLDAASTKLSFHRHKPGIGVGGHCIPVDPYYYIEISRLLGVPSIMSEVSREVNEAMPALAASEIIEIMNRDNESDILLLGFSYKPELGDCRMTPVLELSKELHHKGLKVHIWDPYVKDSDFPDFVEIVEDPYSTSKIGAVVLCTAHKLCINLDWSKMLECCPSAIIYDGRRELVPEEMQTIGWQYFGVGYSG